MGEKAFFLGIDVGSTVTKAVAVDASGAVAGRCMVPSGVDFAAAAAAAAKGAGEALGGMKAARTVATGLGRRNVDFADSAVTEIKCHARGAVESVEPPFTLVDIGGQDNKVISVERDGRVGGFTMNRKCAAGTGAFIEEIARRLGQSGADLQDAASRSDSEAQIGSFCTVFAATEVLHQIRAGTPVGAIARGALRSVVKRVLEMIPASGRIALSGGVAAYYPLVARMLAEETGYEVTVVEQPQYAGALGAALIAAGRGEA